jgi:hypothetical protein
MPRALGRSLVSLDQMSWEDSFRCSWKTKMSEKLQLLPTRYSHKKGMNSLRQTLIRILLQKTFKNIYINLT